MLETALAVLSGIFTVLWWLLRQKDERQEEAIKLLFTKHDSNEKKIDAFQLEVAKMHYVKPELDAKFDRLEVSIKEGMHELGTKFDKLSDVLIKKG
jgi:hypothetical protein